MRILHIVTLVSPDGAYGGPVRVASNLAAAQAELGHEVLLAGGWRGGDTVPDVVSGVPAKLFKVQRAVPKAGFAGLTSLGLLRWLRSQRGRFDVVHVHAARDLITLPGAAAVVGSGTRLFLQPHGMIDESTRRSAWVFDRLLTRRIMRRANSVLYLTPVERSSLIKLFGAGILLVETGNGVPPTTLQTSSDSTEVLFLARMHERKRPLHFIAAAHALASEFPEWTFRLVGPDEGEEDAIARAIAQDGGPFIRCDGPIPPDATLERMSRAAVYVLPSVDEPYPMSVLEAMSVGLPVVVTDSCGLAPLLLEHGAGTVISPSVESLVVALREILSSPDHGREMGVRGRQLTRDHMSIQAVAERVLGTYDRDCSSRG